MNTKSYNLFFLFISLFFVSTANAGVDLCSKQFLSSFNILTQEAGSLEERIAKSKAYFKTCEKKHPDKGIMKIFDFKVAGIQNQMYQQKALIAQEAIENCDDNKMTPQRLRDLQDVGNLKFQRVKRIINSNYINARADSNDFMKQVGQLAYINDFGKEIHCNATYIELPDGRIGFNTSAHCIYKKGKIKTGSLGGFRIKMGMDSRSPDAEIKIKSSHCAETIGKMGAKDECFLEVYPHPYLDPSNVKPIKRRYLTDKELHDFAVSSKAVYLIGFHPSRLSSEVLRGVDGKAYDARFTRTFEKCSVYKPDVGYRLPGTDVQAVPVTCNALDGTSGAGVFVENDKTGELELVSVIKFQGGAEFNFGVSLPPSSLENHVEFNKDYEH